MCPATGCGGDDDDTGEQDAGETARGVLGAAGLSPDASFQQLFLKPKNSGGKSPPTVSQKNGARDALAYKLQHLGVNCTKVLPSRSTLLADAKDLTFWDARLDGTIPVTFIPGAVPSQKNETIGTAIGPANAVVLLGPNGTISGQVVLGSGFFNKDSLIQGSILLHELLHYALQQDDQAVVTATALICDQEIHIAQPLRTGLNMTAKINLSKVLVAPMVLAVFADVIGSGKVLDKRDDGFRIVAVVGLTFMSPSSLHDYYNKLLSQDSTTNVFLISAFENSDTAAQVMAGKGRTEMTFSETVEHFNTVYHSGSSFHMTRLVAIDKDIVVQEANGGKFSKVLLQGTDPTIFRLGRIGCELLEIYFGRLPRAIRPDGRNPVTANLYIKTDMLPTMLEAGEITRKLQIKLHHLQIVVHIRTDSWFLGDSAFPLWYPFEGKSTPPTFEDYKARGEILCSVEDSTIHCKAVRVAGR